MTDETCDYCYSAPATQMRFIGFTVMDGYEYPEVKLWCGACVVTDTIDMRAQIAFLTRQPARRVDNVE